MPVAPLPQVTAPALLIPPLSQSAERTTKLPLGKTDKAVAETLSPAVLPTSELLVDTGPVMPVLPLLQVNAPTSVVNPSSQEPDRTT